MKIYERLKTDHERQRKLADEISRTSGDSDERRQLWTELKIEAEAHANAEEQTLYASLMEESETQEKARHSVSEHKEASDLIEELSDLDMGSGGWLQKFKKLKDELEHHMKEEENEVFAKAKNVIGEEKAEQLRREFDERKTNEVEQMRA